MNRARSFLLLLAVAAAIGGYVWFVEMKRDPTASDEAPREKLVTIDPSQIQEIRLKNDKGEESTLKRSGDRWLLAEVPGAQVDDTEAGNIAAALAGLESNRIVDEQPPSLAEFGLDKPRITAAFTDAAGKQTTVLIGSKTASGGDLYAKLADASRVVLIGSFLEETFNRSRFDLREKSAMKFPRDAVGSITVRNAAGTVSLARSNGVWRIIAPAEGEADEAAVESLISMLSAARMKSIVDNPDIAATGLAKPTATVSLTAGPAQSVMEVGGPAGEDSVYARDTVRGLVFTIESSLADELKKKPEEFRKKAQ